jgi:hypothetical protein
LCANQDHPVPTSGGSWLPGTCSWRHGMRSDATTDAVGQPLLGDSPRQRPRRWPGPRTQISGTWHRLARPRRRSRQPLPRSTTPLRVGPWIATAEATAQWGFRGVASSTPRMDRHTVSMSVPLSSTDLVATASVQDTSAPATHVQGHRNYNCPCIDCETCHIQAG